MLSRVRTFHFLYIYDLTYNVGNDMKCNECGTEHPSYAKFCAKCGAPLAVAPIAVPPAEKASEAPAKESSSFFTKVKEFITNPVYSSTRSIVLYIATGASTLVWLIIGLAVGWTAWMFLPIIILAISLGGFFHEVSKIGISSEELEQWNKARENNRIFKKPIEDPNKFGAKIEYWHASFKPNKMIVIVSTAAILFMYLPLIIGSSVRFATKNPAPGTSQNGGGSTRKYEREFKGFWPEAPYIVKLPSWEDKVISIWDPVGGGRKSYETPLAKSVWFEMEIQVQEGDFAATRGQALTVGYTDITEDYHDRTKEMYFEMDWGEGTTWHQNRYHCSLTISNRGYNNDYKDYTMIESYMFFDYVGE